MTLTFKLPIETIEHKTIDTITLKDLEILETKDTNKDTKSLFDTLYNNEHEVDNLIKEPLMKCYTTDVSFLTQTQNFISKTKDVKCISKNLLSSTFDRYKELSNEPNFYSKYQYIEVNMFKQLNQNQHFMQILSFYNMLSPLITLITPVVILLLPFLLIKMQGIKISFSSYFTSIKHLLKNHAIGKLFNTFNNISWEKRVYLLITIAFYILQIYQNALSCYRFTTNMKHIHSNLFELRDYLNETCYVIDSIGQLTKNNNLNTYDAFQKSNMDCCLVLRELKSELDKISPLKISFTKALQIGNVMRLYYNIKNDPTIISAINYSFHLHSYLNAMKVLSNSKKLNLTTYVDKADNADKADKENKPNKPNKPNKKKDSWTITNMGYPLSLNKSCVFNDVKLNKSIILTGPNASGKTTLLKSAILNTMLSQQIGMGFFKKFTMCPYDNFHCYLDVPDTAGRDSLFQSEARRCLEIINSVQKENTRSFCIFDELYSGTNPTEAVASAYAFINFLSKIKNTDFMLTTHFYKLCKLCKNQKINVLNKQMGWKYANDNTNNSNSSNNSNSANDNYKFTYKITKGISELKGGMRVLKQLNYPTNVINDASNFLK